MTDTDIPPHVRRVLDAATQAIRDVRKLAERLSDRQDELSGLILVFKVHIENLQKAMGELTVSMTGDHVNPGYATKMVLISNELKELKDALEAMKRAQDEAKTVDRQGAWSVAVAVIAAVAAVVGAAVSLLGGAH